MKKDLIIIGAGPAGLMSAIKAAEEGVKAPLILEAMPKPARKLGISGKGRGNITNTASYHDFLRHFNNHGRFLKTAFKKFFNEDLIHFFNIEGLETVIERGGRVFTASGKAPEIVARLVRAAEKRGARILASHRVTSAEPLKEGGFIVKTSQNGHFTAKRLIIATGGQSYPLTGSTGDGYRFAQACGHSIVNPLPSLVPLRPTIPTSAQLEGLLLKNVTATLMVNGKKQASKTGEMMFLDQMLAGAIIITLSRQAVPALAKNNKVEIILDLKPALSHEKLDLRILRDIEKLKNQPLHKLLAGLMPGALIDVCIKNCGLNPKANCANFSAESRRKLRNWLKEWRFIIKEPGPWSQAIVTAGGVNTAEIDQTTMESKLVRGLYLAGEVIDIDADTGGYNLQAAFSTGWLAGASTAASLSRRNS
ncbi:MAG: NAD(P)/FAD-dependent oxidoreductase [Candidatus Rifleibacteriota bacterium]